MPFILVANLFAIAVHLNFWSNMSPRYVMCLLKCVGVLLMVIVLRANILPGRLRFLKAQACVLFVFIVIRHLLTYVANWFSAVLDMVY